MCESKLGITTCTEVSGLLERRTGIGRYREGAVEGCQRLLRLVLGQVQLALHVVEILLPPRLFLPERIASRGVQPCRQLWTPRDAIRSGKNNRGGSRISTTCKASWTWPRTSRNRRWHPSTAPSRYRPIPVRRSSRPLTSVHVVIPSLDSHIWTTSSVCHPDPRPPSACLGFTRGCYANKAGGRKSLHIYGRTWKKTQRQEVRPRGRGNDAEAAAVRYH